MVAFITYGGAACTLNSRHVAPECPELPSGTTVGGLWVGEALLDQKANVWTIRPRPVQPAFPAVNEGIRYFCNRTTKSGAGEAKPAVTAYSELPNSAIVVGTFVAGFEAKGSVI
jgi:hypothetical protein